MKANSVIPRNYQSRMDDLEAMDQQRVLNEQTEAQREQTRIQRVEIIQEIADLERDRDKNTNKLRRASRQTLTRFNFIALEDLFVTTAQLNLRLISRINDWEDLLDTDPEGNPLYPPLGCLSPDTALQEWISQEKPV